MDQSQKTHILIDFWNLSTLPEAEYINNLRKTLFTK